MLRVQALIFSRINTAATSEKTISVDISEEFYVNRGISVRYFE